MDAPPKSNSPQRLPRSPFADLPAPLNSLTSQQVERATATYNAYQKERTNFLNRKAAAMGVDGQTRTVTAKEIESIRDLIPANPDVGEPRKPSKRNNFKPVSQILQWVRWGEAVAFRKYNLAEFVRIAFLAVPLSKTTPLPAEIFSPQSLDNFSNNVAAVDSELRSRHHYDARKFAAESHFIAAINRVPRVRAWAIVLDDLANRISPLYRVTQAAVAISVLDLKGTDRDELQEVIERFTPLAIAQYNLNPKLFDSLYLNRVPEAVRANSNVSEC